MDTFHKRFYFELMAAVDELGELSRAYNLFEKELDSSNFVKLFAMSPQRFATSGRLQRDLVFCNER